MKKLILLLLLIPVLAHAQTSQDKKEIFEVLDNQIKAWNQADIDTYMKGYWKSDSLRFIGKQGIQYGWNATIERYKKSYPDKAAMGTLKFEILSTEFLSPVSAFVIGKWHLTRPEKGDIGGHFTLLWRKINDKWLIVADHSS